MDTVFILSCNLEQYLLNDNRNYEILRFLGFDAYTRYMHHDLSS